MINQTTRVRKIQHRYQLDPDFGTIQPSYAEAYAVYVTPVDSDGYDFITLLPESDSTKESYALLSEVLNEFLNKGDRYDVRDFDEDQVNEFLSNGSISPIISFDPETLDCDQISFLWLRPPKFLMQ